MVLMIWAVIAVIVVVAALLIYFEHEWGFALGGTTAVVLTVSYFCAQLILASPLATALPPNASHFDAMAVTAVVLLVAALIAIAFLAGRRSGAGGKKT